MSNLRVPRVEQLDAVIWNEELYNLLSSQLKKSLQYLPSRYVVAIWPELEAFFRYAFWELSLRSSSGTFGQNLFGIIYKDSQWKLRALAILTTLAPWLWTRILRNTVSANPDVINVLDTVERRFIAAFKLLSLLNFCDFLRRGRYPTIYDRILGLVPTYESVHHIRQVSFESINREILWHGFAEFLSFVLPLLNVHKMKNIFNKVIANIRENQTDREIYSTVCGICGQRPTFPSEIGCGHVFCYYCIKSCVLADEHFPCTCGHVADGADSVIRLSLNS